MDATGPSWIAPRPGLGAFGTQIGPQDRFDRQAGRASRQKKWPLRGAAKFREETPRKGGGFAIEDRNTALQQYAGTGLCLQVAMYNDSRQNAAESLEKSVKFARIFSRLLPPSAFVHCTYAALSIRG